MLVAQDHHVVLNDRLSLRLFADNRLRRTGRRNRICMPMNELPTSVLQPKYAGHAESHRDEFLAADLDSSMFHFDNASKIVRNIFFYEFDAGDLSVTEIRGGAGYSCLNVLATAHIGAEGIPQSYVIRIGEQRVVPAGIAFPDRA